MLAERKVTFPTAPEGGIALILHVELLVKLSMVFNKNFDNAPEAAAESDKPDKSAQVLSLQSLSAGTKRLRV